MRALWAIPLLALMAATVHAQVDLLEDAQGDLQLETADVLQPVPESRFQGIDLVGLSVAEEPDAFRLSVGVAGLDKAPEVPGVDDGIVRVNLRHGDQEYQVVFMRALGDQSYYWGYLLKYDADGHRNFQRILDVYADPSASTLSTALWRNELLDRSGAAPFPGRVLDGWWASSSLRSNEGFANVNGIDPGHMYNVFDRMPDKGIGNHSLPVRLGLEQSGHAALWSTDPVRASNGEQATFVFNVTAHNSGSSADTFQLVSVGTPRDWQVTFPQPHLRIGAGSSVQVPVLVSTPFSHVHGVLQTFRLELRSDSDPGSVGRLDLGIRYFTIPQPGGHHDTTYLHSSRFGSDSPLFTLFEAGFSGNSGWAYLNTLDNDPEDAGVPITGMFYGFYCDDACPPEPPVSQWRWDIYLQPGLEMGLDFDLLREGRLDLPLGTQVPLPQAVLSGSLVHLRYDEAAGDWNLTTIAAFEAEPRDLMPGEKQLYSLPLQIRPEADLLPYAKRAYLGLYLQLTSPKPTLFTGVEAPQLLPGGVMQMPLFDFRDSLDLANFAGPVQLSPVGDVERSANPGKTVIFKVQLANGLARQADFDLTLSGTNLAWARLLGPPTVQVPAGQTVELRVAVAVPAGAVARDTADLVLVARVSDQPELSALHRFLARVDPQLVHEDEASLAVDGDPMPTKPGSAAPALLVLVTVLALALRRRGTPLK